MSIQAIFNLCCGCEIKKILVQPAGLSLKIQSDYRMYWFSRGVPILYTVSFLKS